MLISIVENENSYLQCNSNDNSVKIKFNFESKFLDLKNVQKNEFNIHYKGIIDLGSKWKYIDCNAISEIHYIANKSDFWNIVLKNVDIIIDETKFYQGDLKIISLVKISTEDNNLCFNSNETSSILFENLILLEDISN